VHYLIFIDLLWLIQFNSIADFGLLLMAATRTASRRRFFFFPFLQPGQ